MARGKTMRKGRKLNKSHRRRNKTVRRRRKSQKGGMLAGVLKAAKTALLPFLMYKAQKRVQKRSRKNRTRRRR